MNAESTRGEALSRRDIIGRISAIAAVTSAFALLREVAPAQIANATSLHLSCGAVTGLPCIFCGFTRAMHFLLNGNFSRAIYFNWLAIPALAVSSWATAVLIAELIVQRRLWRWDVSFSLTRRRAAAAFVVTILLWVTNASLAVTQHKTELLNPDGPLYALFVR